MAQYQVKIQVASIQVPEPAPMPAYDPGKDPLHAVTQVMRESLTSLRGPSMPTAGPYFSDTGLTLTKEIVIHAESFEELAKALGQFDALAEQIECSHPTKKW